MNYRVPDDGELRLRDVLSRTYEVCLRSGEANNALVEASRLLSMPEDTDTAFSQDQLKESIEILSGGENTVLFDEAGLPSVMVRIPMLSLRDVLLASDSNEPHPAFVLGGRTLKEIYVSKFQNCELNGRAYSLPMARPKNRVGYDESIQLCRSKGPGWGLMPFQLRMAIALYCRKQGFLPNGNNARGQDFFHPDEKGIPADEGLTLTGSGPKSWAHNQTSNGIYDLNGNLNEWDAGFRLFNGEIQLVTMDDLFAANGGADELKQGWQAVDAKGRLVQPGSGETLKYDVPQGSIRLTQKIETEGIGNCAFADMQSAAGLDVPLIMQSLGLYPQEDRLGYGQGWRWISTSGEAMPLCGGAYKAEDHAGIFFAGITYPRTQNYPLTGFRSIYIDLHGGEPA